MATLRPLHHPFRSMVGFLHPDNAAQRAPRHLQAIVDRVARRGQDRRGQVITMAPGDSWDSDTGVRSQRGRLVRRAGAASRQAAGEVPALARGPREELGRTVEWDAFAAALGRLMRSAKGVRPAPHNPRPFIAAMPSTPTGRTGPCRFAVAGSALAQPPDSGSR
ncbi:MAG: hypothetical protein R2695_05620 [Acidimicrobiales bacterium]